MDRIGRRAPRGVRQRHHPDPRPRKALQRPEWRYSGCMFPSTGTPEETIEKIREQNPAAVSIHMEQVYLWTRRDKTADAEKEARRAAEQAERDARRHALEEYAAASADKRMAWLHANLRHQTQQPCRNHGPARTPADHRPGPAGLHAGAEHMERRRMRWRTIHHHQRHRTGTGARRTPLPPRRTRLGVWAVQILAARIEWFIDPTDWDHRQRHQQTHPRLLPDPPRPRPDHQPTTKPATSTSSPPPSAKPTPTKTRRTTNDQEQLERLAQLLTDTAQTASTIEVRALAAGRADTASWRWRPGLRPYCTSCLVLVDGLMQEGVRCE